VEAAGVSYQVLKVITRGTDGTTVETLFGSGSCR
jgi:hypothetical protein